MEVKSLDQAPVELSAEARDLQAPARSFVEDVIMPLEERAEEVGGRLRPGAIAVVKQAGIDAGLDGGMHAVEHGGRGWSRLEWTLVEEQVGRPTNAIVWDV